LFVQKLFIICNLTNRWVNLRCYFNQVKTHFARYLNGFCYRVNPLLKTIAYNTNCCRSNFFVNAM
jgi:hypothetical protein